MSEFTNRVFGCAIVKAVNANYNADFTHQPRTLPDGTVYATDKAFKYSIRNYWIDQYPQKKVLYFKRLNAELNPLTLAEAYDAIFGQDSFKQDKNNKTLALTKLLQCLDVRLFGATFAAKSGNDKLNISIHGPVQINHGTNRFFIDGKITNEIYSEQIMSPFRNPEAEGREQREAATLGQQSKLKEGHYVHHFSINPQNLTELLSLAENATGLTRDDIDKLKEAMRYGVSYYDSAAKAGTDNELLFWVQMKENSKKVLPVFTEFITVNREGSNVVVNFGELQKMLSKVPSDIERIEVYYIPEHTRVENLPDNCNQLDLVTGNAIG